MAEAMFTEKNSENDTNDSDWGIEFTDEQDKEYFETLKQDYDEHVRGAERTVKFQREIRKEMINYLSEKEIHYETAAKIMDWKIQNLYTWSYNYGGKFKRGPAEKKQYTKTPREVYLIYCLIKAAERKMVDPDRDKNVKNLRKLLDPGYTETED